MNNGKLTQLELSVFLGVITAYAKIVAVPVTVLLLAMIIDYITGMTAAWHRSELSSKKGVFGITKKVSYLALVCVGMGADWLIYSGLQYMGISLEYTLLFGVVVTIWLIINELTSILENLGQIGVPLPKFLLKVVNHLKNTVERHVDKGDKNE